MFVRNQFGYSAGGPIIKNQLFIFSSTEWIRVRSAATAFAWAPTPDLIAQTPANTQNFFQAYGQLRSSASSFGSITRNGLTNLLGTDPCAGPVCACLPGTLPLFHHVAYNVPADAGGANPQTDQAGVVSSSPYNNYDLAQTYLNHNALFSVIQTFSPSLVSQSKVVFNRLTNRQ